MGAADVFTYFRQGFGHFFKYLNHHTFLLLKTVDKENLLIFLYNYYTNF